MRKVGFIGAYDKADLIMYIAKMLTLVNKKVLIVDTTINQKTKYIVPVINPTISYVTEFEDIDIAIGFKTVEDIKKYLGKTENSDLNYDYILMDIDIPEAIENLDARLNFKNYFVTSFDTYSIKKGLEIISDMSGTINLTKVLYSKEMIKEEDDYLNYLSLGYKVVWSEYRIYFPIEMGDQTAISENQRLSKIKFKNLTSQYRESLMYIAEELLEGENPNILKKALKTLERGE